jgi:hypothetical protein
MKIRQELTISELRACGIVGLARTTLRRVVVEAPDTTSLKTRIIDLALLPVTIARTSKVPAQSTGGPSPRAATLVERPYRAGAPNV